MNLALGILAGVLLLSTIGTTIWGFHWRNNFAGIRGAYDELVDQAAEANEEAERAKAELDFLKNTVSSLATRPSMVVLSDEPLGFLCSSISQIVVGAMRDPARLN